MRIFQNSGIYDAYRPRLAKLTRDSGTFEQSISIFLDDRFGAAHFLLPVLEGSPDAFFANGDDAHSQKQWAREHGLSKTADLPEILLAQIENHRTEVFYNLDPMRYGDAFLARLPGCVKRTVAWRAAPSAGGKFLAHDIIVNNFPTLLEGYRLQGARAEYLAPAHDPEMDLLAKQANRPVDILFVGTYSRYHQRRAEMLRAIATLQGQAVVAMNLDVSRFTRLAESGFGKIAPLGRFRRPPEVQKISRNPVFGRDLLSSLCSAKVVVNGAIDMALGDRGNMRIWEALGCGCALITDAGNYPNPMISGRHFVTYESAEDVADIALQLVNDKPRRSKIASTGNQMIRDSFSKLEQWKNFVNLVN